MARIRIETERRERAALPAVVEGKTLRGVMKIIDESQLGRYIRSLWESTIRWRTDYGHSGKQ
jgi:hypothetical protein